MTTKINRRAITGPRDAANKVAIESLQFAVQELGGAVGSNMQRAVRVCELVDAGILQLMPDGQLGRNTSVDQIGIIDIADVTGLQAALDAKFDKAGGALTGSLTLPTGSRIFGDFNNATQSNRTMFQASAINGNTSVGLIPNGSGTVTLIQAHNNSDANNAGAFQFRMEGTVAVINSSHTGSGVTRDIHFQFDGASKAWLTTNGQLTLSGTGTGYVFQDRTSSRAWQWYGTGDAARLHNGSNDVFSVGPDATVGMSGKVAIGGAAVGADQYNQVTVNGGVRSRGAGATLGFQDRGTSTDWNWYSSGNMARLWLEGSGDRFTVDSAGRASATDFQAGYYPNAGNSIACSNWFRSNGNTGWFNGSHSVGIYATQAGQVRTYNGANFLSEGSVYVTTNYGIVGEACYISSNSGMQFNGLVRFTQSPYQLAANAGQWVRQIRVFTQAGDPGAWAEDGDLWAW